jgi:hypothetical protein
MDGQLYNGFCPNCGALLRDGVCPSCGFSESDAEMETENTEYSGQRNYERYQNSYLNQVNTSYDSQGDYNYNQNAYTQNQYYQNTGNAQGYYQQNGYYGVQTPPKKSMTKGAVIAAIIGGVLFLLLIILGIFILVSAIGTVIEESRENSYQYDTDDYDWDDYDEDDYDWDDYDWGDYDEDDYDRDDDRLDFVDDIAWNDNYWSKEPYNYETDEVGDEYYYGLCNCIDKTVPYDFVYENYEQLDKSQNVCIRINYYQLEGDIPNLDEINETLKMQAIWPGEVYTEWSEDFEEIFDEYGAGYVVSVESYVTYNDEKSASVVSDIYYETAVSVKKVINSVNIDLEKGEILDNTEIIDVTDTFLDEYKEICEEQNGSVSIFSELDNDELREFFEDEDDLILFYTPCGMELGINYETDMKYGWVTATLTEYEQYLK